LTIAHRRSILRIVTTRAGEIVGELVLAIKLRTPLATLADVIEAFRRSTGCLGRA